MLHLPQLAVLRVFNSICTDVPFLSSPDGQEVLPPLLADLSLPVILAIRAFSARPPVFVSR